MRKAKHSFHYLDMSSRTLGVNFVSDFVVLHDVLPTVTKLHPQIFRPVTCLVWTYRGVRFTQSQIYLLFVVLVIPKLTISSI